MTRRRKADPAYARLALLAVFLAMIYGCEKMHQSFRTGENPEGIGRAMENIRLPDGATGTITGSLALAADETGGPYTVHVEGFRGTAVSVSAGESFTLENVPIGERRVMVYERNGSRLVDGTHFGLRAESVTVAAGKASDVGTLTLVPVGAIHGSVEGIDGAESFAYIPGSWFMTRIGRDGSYTLDGVPQGHYRITVTRAGSLDGYSDQVKVVGGVMVDAPMVTIDQPFVTPGAIALDQASAFGGSRTVSVSISQDAAANMIMLSESTTFNEASWNSIPETVEYTFGSDGPHRLYAKFKISSKYETQPVSDIIYVFTGVPTGTLAMQNGMGFSAVRDVMLAITGEDIAGVTEMILSEDSTFAGASWEPFAKTRMFTLGATIGMHTVYLKLKDSCEHVSEVISAEIGYEPKTPDPPSIAVVQGVYTDTRNITLRATLAKGAAPLSWALVSESSDFAGAAWQTYQAPHPYTLSAGEGAKTIYARFKDSAGNLLDPVSTTTWLDLTPPTTPAISNTSRRVVASSETIVITTPSTDSLFKTYVARGGAYADWTEVTQPIVFALANNDTWYDLEVRGKDLAGNMSESAAIRLFRGNQTILDGSAAQQTGEASRTAGSATATLPYLFSPYLLRGTDSSTTFSDYNLSIEAGVELDVTAGLGVAVEGLTVAGTSAKHVTLTSANSNKAAGDWRALTLSGTTVINYLDVAYYTYATIPAGDQTTTINNSTFTNFASYALSDSSTGTTSMAHTTIICPSSATQTGYSAKGTAPSTRNLSAMDIEHCYMGVTISGAPMVDLSDSNIVDHSMNSVYITSSATGTITFTGNYFGYGTLGGTLADLAITCSRRGGTFTWSDYAIKSVTGTGPAP